MAVGVWPVVPGQGPFCLVGRSWVTWWRRLEVASAVQFLGLVVVVLVCAGRPACWCVQSLDRLFTCPLLSTTMEVVDPCCSSSTSCGRPCGYAATPSRSGRCHRFSSSPDLVDTLVCTETGGFLQGFDGDEGEVGAHHTGDELN